MAWEKQGLIYAPDGTSAWAKHSVMTPTPVVLDDETIRIYCGFRDDEGVTRLGFIDVDAKNPKVVKRVTDKPILDVGMVGTFDDNGLILGEVVKEGQKVHLYYVGFQIPQKVKFLAFSGLAISEDGGETFERYGHAPVMDRTDKAPYIRAIHSMLKEDGVWRVWYSIGDGWEHINGVDYPRYRICHTTSKDGIHFADTDEVCFDVGSDEYRIGRPRVTKMKDGYVMRATADTFDKFYHTTLATSKDGINWTRRDDLADLHPSEEKSAWDGETAVYPVEVEVGGTRYLFYSGNGMGRTGVGYAVWKE